MDHLIKKYKLQTPAVQPLWDTLRNSITHNDICLEIIRSGLILYTAPFIDVYNGIFEPAVYHRNTLWKTLHDSDKIVRVIQHWEQMEALSPVFLVKHGNQNLGLISDGKHRFTTAGYMNCDMIPFMVPSSDNKWVKIAIPSAVQIPFS